MEYQHNHNQTSITGWLSKFAKASRWGRKNVGIPEACEHNGCSAIGTGTNPKACPFLPDLPRA
jgi:hypothetical protein